MKKTPLHKELEETLRQSTQISITNYVRNLS